MANLFLMPVDKCWGMGGTCAEPHPSKPDYCYCRLQVLPAAECERRGRCYRVHERNPSLCYCDLSGKAGQRKGAAGAGAGLPECRLARRIDCRGRCVAPHPANPDYCYCADKVQATRRTDCLSRGGTCVEPHPANPDYCYCALCRLPSGARPAATATTRPASTGATGAPTGTGAAGTGSYAVFEYCPPPVPHNILVFGPGGRLLARVPVETAVTLNPLYEVVVGKEGIRYAGASGVADAVIANLSFQLRDLQAACQKCCAIAGSKTTVYPDGRIETVARLASTQWGPRQYDVRLVSRYSVRVEPLTGVPGAGRPQCQVSPLTRGPGSSTGFSVACPVTAYRFRVVVEAPGAKWERVFYDPEAEKLSAKLLGLLEKAKAVLENPPRGVPRETLESISRLYEAGRRLLVVPVYGGATAATVAGQLESLLNAVGRRICTPLSPATKSLLEQMRGHVEELASRLEQVTDPRYSGQAQALYMSLQGLRENIDAMLSSGCEPEPKALKGIERQYADLTARAEQLLAAAQAPAAAPTTTVTPTTTATTTTTAAPTAPTGVPGDVASMASSLAERLESMRSRVDRLLDLARERGRPDVAARLSSIQTWIDEQLATLKGIAEGRVPGGPSTRSYLEGLSRAVESTEKALDAIEASLETGRPPGPGIVEGVKTRLREMMGAGGSWVMVAAVLAIVLAALLALVARR